MNLVGHSHSRGDLLGQVEALGDRGGREEGGELRTVQPRQDAGVRQRFLESLPDAAEHDVAGFMTHFGSKWGRLGTDRAFVPQYVMYCDPPAFARRPDRIDADIRTFFVEHGFNGFHIALLCRWFDFDKLRSHEIASPSPNPDPRTFEALELLLGKVHAAGGVVHIWAWGDEQRRMTPKKWGINGAVDRRLQRY